MVINIASVKSEALLLFCRDLIDSYKSTSLDMYVVDDDLKEFVSKSIDDISKAINVLVRPNDYYIRNLRVINIKIVLKHYNLINKLVTEYLEKEDSFNPSMLCFALLSTWFKELEYEHHRKEYIFFGLYPYWEVFDRLIVKSRDLEYKRLNVKMVQIAESVMLKLDKKGLK
jgi:hypothetical protein